MRMRKKTNLESRIERNAQYLLLRELNFYTEPEKQRKEKFDLRAIFGNDNPVWLEIGCGKGGFAVQTAIAHPEVNIIALEVVSNVIVVGLEQAAAANLPNLRFINCAAEHLNLYFEDDSFDRIFLNFSCPYPKHTYANRRLTAHKFLQVYKKVLKVGCEIDQKTDNVGLFEFSIQTFSECGYTLRNVTLDLHKSNFEGNIMTEYERKFVGMGKPIYRLEAHLLSK